MPASEPRTASAARADGSPPRCAKPARIALKYLPRAAQELDQGRGDSPVTEADIAVDDFLRERLVAPGFGWLSEESEDDPTRLQRAASGSSTRSTARAPIIAGRAGLVDRRPRWSRTAGRCWPRCIAPVTEELFLAAAGEGATRNGAPIRANTGGELDGARVAGPEAVLDRLARRSPASSPMPRVHSLALRLARVAHGALDAAFAGGNSHDWDLAAADLLVHEAGGAMTDVRGRSR